MDGVPKPPPPGLLPKAPPAGLLRKPPLPGPLLKQLPRNPDPAGSWWKKDGETVENEVLAWERAQEAEREVDARREKAAVTKFENELKILQMKAQIEKEEI